MFTAKKIVAGTAMVAMLATAGVVGASVNSVKTTGAGEGRARVVCPGGMSRLGHEFNEQMSIFPGDPAVSISNVYTVPVDYFRVEDIDTGAHAGTHLDVPAHFIDDRRSLEDFAAEEFVWPAYKIDVRGMDLTDGLVEKSDIRAYERANGRIKSGSLVVLQTGAEEFFGLDGEDDMRLVDADGLSANTDDLFNFENAGFSGDAVQWLFDNRDIDGIGSDAYGPDAYSDGDYLATFTALDNDGIALVALANLDSVSVRSDVIMAPTVALTDGTGFSTDPIACHGNPWQDNDNDDDGDRDDH